MRIGDKTFRIIKSVAFSPCFWPRKQPNAFWVVYFPLYRFWTQNTFWQFIYSIENCYSRSNISPRGSICSESLWFLWSIYMIYLIFIIILLNKKKKGDIGVNLPLLWIRYFSREGVKLAWISSLLFVFWLGIQKISFLKFSLKITVVLNSFFSDT